MFARSFIVVLPLEKHKRIHKNLYIPKMKHFFLVLFFACCAVGTGQGESSGSGLEAPDVNSLVSVPNSPEAEAFARYGNIPISYYTGKPNVSVPVYTISGKEVSVPVSLTYDSSGIKVQSISTSAGAGWNLNAGGMVSRQVHGLADDMLAGHVTYPITNSAVKALNTYLNSFRNAEYGYYFNFEYYEHEQLEMIKFNQMKVEHSLLNADLMPDIYSFHAPGLSGSMMIDPSTGVAISLKDPDIKAQYTLGAFGAITGWSITNAAGTVYSFTVAEETTTTFSSSEGPEGTRVYNSAWHLTKIESANKKDVFDFTYTNATYWDQPQLHYNQQTAQNVLTPCGRANKGDNTFITSSSLTDFRIKQSTLSSIRHNDVTIMNFYQDTERLDLKGRKS